MRTTTKKEIEMTMQEAIDAYIAAGRRLELVRARAIDLGRDPDRRSQANAELTDAQAAYDAALAAYDALATEA